MRDLHIIRAIVLQVAASEQSDAVGELRIDANQGVIQAHVAMCIDQGFLARDPRGNIVLDWEGHEFACIFGDDELWQSLSVALEATGLFCYEIAKQMAITYLVSNGQHTGGDSHLPAD